MRRSASIRSVGAAIFQLDETSAGPGQRAAALVRIEAAALLALATHLEGPGEQAYGQAIEMLTSVVRGGGRVVLSGMGKSGLIARKIAATMVSLGVPALFLHPAEALHGDLGLLCAGDILLALSYSGETEELLRLLPALARMGVAVLSFCGCPESALARGSGLVLDVSVEREACAHQLAPTASTTAMLALGDALAVELSRCLGFAPQDFADLHPGGHLGRRLTPLRELMHTGEACPVVPPDAPMPTVIHEMSAKRLGMTTVQENGRLLGLVSDGDLRRLFEREGPAAFHHTAAEVMNATPRTVSGEMFAAAALDLMEAHKITALILTADGTQSAPVQGVVHLHDLVQALARTR